MLCGRSEFPQRIDKKQKEQNNTNREEKQKKKRKEEEKKVFLVVIIYIIFYLYQNILSFLYISLIIFDTKPNE